MKAIKKVLLKFEYSFFNIPVYHMLRASKMLSGYNESDPLNYEKANTRAAFLLIQGHAEKALPLINRTVLRNPSGIQPLINKGIALLQLPDAHIDELEIISAKIKELTQNRCSYFQAKVYYTYWLLDCSPATFEHFIVALELFESVLKKK